MKWHWPTEDGWLTICILTLFAGLSYGLSGVLYSLGFFALVNILGNVFLP